MSELTCKSCEHSQPKRLQSGKYALWCGHPAKLGFPAFKRCPSFCYAPGTDEREGQ